MTFRVIIHIHTENLSSREIDGEMPLGLFVKELQSKVGLAGYDILFVYFVVKAKTKFWALTKKIGG